LGWREKTNCFFRHSLQIGTPISIANIATIQGPDAWLDLYSLKLLAVTAVMYAKVGHMRPRVQQGIVTADNIRRSLVLILLCATVPCRISVSCSFAKCRER
ncbi:MAG TPA: hypothetical protein VNZ04_04805, partial [Trinickia sp.]|nr:hypothetical protein [Trinickia sp.]